MPQYLSPGVYVEETDSGSRPIEGVGTAVAAFIGLAEKGPTNEPVLVTNWAQFTSQFGEFTEGGYLAHAVYGYFLNGGGSCLCRARRCRWAGARASAGEGGANGRRRHQGRCLPGHGSGQRAGRQRRFGRGCGARRIARGRLQADRAGERGKVEEFDGLTTRRGRQNAMMVVNARSELIRLEETAPVASLQRPNVGTISLTGGGAPQATAPARLSPRGLRG